MDTKICKHCKKELNIDNFRKNKTNKDGKASTCKKCIAIKENKFREKNREKLRQYASEYRAKNAIKIKEKRDKNKEKTKIWRQENKHYIKAHNTAYVIKNEEQYKNRMKELTKIWRQNNKEQVNILHQRYQSRKQKLKSTLTKQQWDQIKQYFNNKCCYCGRELPLQQEHFIPLSKLGEYTVNNIMPACKSCNCSKHDSLFENWYPNYKYYSKKREKSILKFLGYNDDNQQLRII